MMRIVFLCLMLLFLSGKLSAKNIYAVVVGVASYENPKIGKLHFSDDDAKDFYKMLLNLGVPAAHIVLLTDREAKKAAVLAAMRRMFSKAKEEDMIIFFFSGHGDTGVFMTHDFYNRTSGLLHEEVKEAFKNSKAKTKLCFADACKAGSIKEDKNTQTASANKVFGQGIAVMLSSRASQLSQEQPVLQRGVFTFFLIEGMKGKADKDRNRILTISELYYYVREKVSQKTNKTQVPIIFGQFDENMPLIKFR
jgi:uncharacterized caspase-like protein